MVWRCCNSRFFVLLLAFGAGSTSSSNLAQFIEQLHFSFFPPGHEVNISLGPLGVAHLQNLDCQGVRLDGLEASATILNADQDYAGGVRLGASIGSFSATCTGTWLLRRETGYFYLDLATARNAGAPPFAAISLDVEGRAVRADEGTLYPLPDRATKLSCSTDFEVRSLRFDGASKRLLNLLAGLLSSDVLQRLLRPLLCAELKKQGLGVANSLLVRARQVFEGLLLKVPGDLPVPQAAPRVPSLYDLGQSRLLAFLQRLVEQGMWTGELVDLIERATGNSDVLSFKFKNGGMPWADLSIEHPAKMDLRAFLERSSVLGPQTIDHLSLKATSDRTMALRLAQQLMNVSVSFRAQAHADSAEAGFRQDTDAYAPDVVRRLGAALLERGSLRVLLENVDLAGRLGLLLDAARVHYLAEGTSWYDLACVRTMILNASAIGFDLLLDVKSFRFEIDGASPGDLEVQVDSSINSLLEYVNSPLMQPTVSRLLRSFAAGPALGLANEAIQQWLSAQAVCEPIFGTGSSVIFALMASVGFVVAAVAACFVCWRYRKCSAAASSAARTPPAALLPEPATASAATDPAAVSLPEAAVSSSAPPARSGEALANVPALLLAIAAGFLIFGGLLGNPFRAAFRLHNGSDPDGDSLLYIYVLTVGMELARKCPGDMLLLWLLVLLLGTSRILVAMIVAARPQCRLIFHRYLRFSSAFAAWDFYVLHFTMAGEVPGYYAKVATFGDTYIDLGGQINLDFYVHALGLVLLDVATCLLLGPSLAVVKARVAAEVVETSQAHAEDQVRRRHVCSGDGHAPPLAAMVALGIALLALLVAPFLTLWSYSYTGAIMELVHYQTGSQRRSLSLAGILTVLPNWVLNPFDGLGPFVMQVFLVAQVVVVPILHAGLALFVAVRLRRGDGSSACFFAKRAASVSASSSRRSLGRSPASASDGLPDASTFATSNLEAAAAPERSELARLRHALALLRMWAGADAFACMMLVGVLEISSQTELLAKMPCALVMPILDKFGLDCAGVDPELHFGLFVYLAAGLSARVLAEICAHAPLRARESVAVPWSPDEGAQG
eukprot:TRINITY_DN2792_c0_g2_i1.p1 TRINITY_DN2792_c0_g2~~TRINITY_DN2792_c0_g2_i1.p1  ORF type:complete len:1068 (+),score=182.71 TRINITY_DN2792_c0_g2_i1:107-3310(+)